MEQTAVDFLVEQLDGERHLTESEIKRVIEKAQNMFQEQIIQAAQHEPFLGNLPRTEGEHYYEKTFKTKD